MWLGKKKIEVVVFGRSRRTQRNYLGKWMTTYISKKEWGTIRLAQEKYIFLLNTLLRHVIKFYWSELKMIRDSVKNVTENNCPSERYPAVMTFFGIFSRWEESVCSCNSLLLELHLWVAASFPAEHDRFSWCYTCQLFTLESLATHLNDQNRSFRK